MPYIVVGNNRGPRGIQGIKGEPGGKYSSLLPGGTNLATFFTEGTWRTETSTLTATILGRPTGFSQPFELEQVTLSEANGIHRQTLTMKTSGESTILRVSRISLSGSYGGWAWDELRYGLLAGEDLDTKRTPGTYTADLGGTAASLLSRPVGFTNPAYFVVKVSGSVVFQYGVSWSTEGILRRERRTAGGVFGPWVDSSDTASQLRDDYISIFGDSQSEGTWSTYATPLLTGTTFIDYAKSGDNSTTMALRNGFITPKFIVQGGSLPASGPVTLTTSARFGLRNNRPFAVGSIAGVAGSLTHVENDTYTFTRSTSGTTVPAAGWQPFSSNIETAAKYMLLWIGGNDFNEIRLGQERSIADHIIGAYRAFVAKCITEGRQPIIAGVTNRLGALFGSEGFLAVQYINRTLRAQYPDIFLDVQAYYVEHAIYDAGLTPSAADLAAIDRGEIPPQLFLSGDEVHLIPAAHKAIGEKWIAPWLAAKGFSYTTATLPALPELHPADMGIAA